MEKIPMRVMGLSYSQIKNGAYALILSQVNGPLKMPIIIGSAEAQSVALKLEGITPPRPLTHDLFVSFAQAFGVTLKEVLINAFEDGIFSSELTFTDGEREVVLEARTSDAIAIAMRTKTPIYTTRQVLDETGFVLEIGSSDAEADDTDDEDTGIISMADDAPLAPPANPKLEHYAAEELEKLLADLIAKEKYEEAARVSDILKRKRGKA